jgi:hypothetical protein
VVVQSTFRDYVPSHPGRLVYQKRSGIVEPRNLEANTTVNESRYGYLKLCLKLMRYRRYFTLQPI